MAAPNSQNFTRNLILTFAIGESVGGIESCAEHLKRFLQTRASTDQVRVLSMWPHERRPWRFRPFRAPMRAWFMAKLACEAVKSSLTSPPDRVWVLHLDILSALSPTLLRRSIVYLHGDELWNCENTRTLTVLSQARGLIAVSEFTAECTRNKLGELKLSIPPIDVIPPPIHSPESSTPTKPSSNATLSFDTEPLKILTLARQDARQQHKGTDTLIEATALLAKQGVRTRLKIAGTGTDLSRLRALSTQLGCDASIEFIGFVPSAEISDLYRWADLFVMASGKMQGSKLIAEGFGIVYLEAASYGVPSIGLKIGGTSDAIVDGGTGILIDHQDANMLSQAILRLRNDPALLKKMGRSAFDRFDREFSFKAQNRRWNDFLSKLEAPL